METRRENLPKHFSPENIIKGNTGEQVVAHLLRKKGYFVTCLSGINERNKNGAPGMRDDSHYLALPDLQVAARGNLGYCEVKCKENPTFTRKTRQYDHGIDKHCWDYYEQVQRLTGLKVFLFIYEWQSGAVLYNSIIFLDNVKRFTDRWGKTDGRGGKKGGYFFPRSSFIEWGYVAVVGEDYYQQLDMFSMMSIEGEGDKLFEVTVIRKEL